MKVQISHSGRAQRRSLILLRQEVYHSSLTSPSTARFDFVVTMFREGKIDEDTVDCPRFVAFKGASDEDSSSSFYLGQLTKRIHGESDEFDEEEARQAQRKDRTKTGAILFGVANWVHIHLKPTSMCGINVVGGGGGGGREGEKGSDQSSGTTRRSEVWVLEGVVLLPTQAFFQRRTKQSRVRYVLYFRRERVPQKSS